MKKSMMLIFIATLSGYMDYALAASETNDTTPQATVPAETTPNAAEQQPDTAQPLQTAPAQAADPVQAAPKSSITSPPTNADQTQKINCDYHIPATTKTIEQPIVVQWATQAAEQSFDFDHKAIDSQLEKLKACYTKQGWESFSSALQKSGNLNAIRTEKLTVSSMIDGEASINIVEPNQWKVNLPLNVVYQNEKEKLNQALNIMLLIGRKTNGDLGILQLVAMPRQNAGSAVNPPSETTPNTNNVTQPAENQ